MSEFPVLLSIPHGGKKIPHELENHLCINQKDLFDDSDPFVIEIYDIGNNAKSIIKTEIARAFVDLNRAPNDLPPNNPDGVIKSATCYQKPIYSKQPDDELRKILIKSYYEPYHKEITELIRKNDFKICLDCHSMAAIAPSISPDGNNKKRPLFCLSNQNGKTSTTQMIDYLAECISEAFSINIEQISKNDPFQGGYITKTYGNKPFPWIQIEMNRDLYLSKPWFDELTFEIDPVRLAKLNECFERTLEIFFQK